MEKYTIVLLFKVFKIFKMPVATEKNNFLTQNFRRPSLTTFINLHAKGFHSGHLTSWHGVGIHAKGFWYVSPYYNEENCGT